MTSLLAKLRRDEGGAISVMGIFMAVLLVAFIYFIGGLAETMMYRERMQDAVDATGWAAAVVHARGMNIIVLLNMVMASIAAVLITLKIILMVLTILIVVFTVLAAIPYTAAVGEAGREACQEAKDSVQEVHDNVEEFANETWPILNQTATAIRWAVPAIAFAKSTSVATSVYGMKFGGFYSSTLTGGLPVEDDECKKLEEMGSKYVGRLVSSPSGDENVRSNFDKAFNGLGNAAMALAGHICDDDSGDETVTFDGSGLADDMVSQSEDCDDIYEDCSDADTSGAEDIELSNSNGSSGTSSSDSDKAPKRVKEDCELGDDCFQIRAGVVGEPRITETREGVAIATWGATDDSESALKELARFNLAQAEFYFDMANADQQRNEWMWRQNWRARMRRFRFGSGSSAMNVFDGSGEAGLGGFGDSIQNIMVH